MRTPEEFAEEMRRISEIEDTKLKHSQADSLMMCTLDDLGYEEGTNIFCEMIKWYS